MRHGKKINHLGRTSAHRKAMLSNMACSLILHKRINTTLAKAKALKRYVEPLVTKSKNDSTHSRRVVFSYLNDKHVVSELFRDVAPKVADRPGGYTRIIKTGNRLGDNAEMCMMELVDFNELYVKETKEQSQGGKRRRRRGGSRKSAASSTEATAENKEVETKSEEAPKAETSELESPKAEAEKKEVSNKTESTAEPKAEEKKDASAETSLKEENKDKDDSAKDDSTKA